jgi:transposase
MLYAFLYQIFILNKRLHHYGDLQAMEAPVMKSKYEPTPYCNMVNKRSKGEQEAIRLQMVRYAEKHGKNATERKFGCSKNTVDLWVERYKVEGRSGLVNRSRAPKSIPHKTSQKDEAHILKCRKEAPCYGPKRLKWFFEIKASEDAIRRILKERGIARKRRKKHHTKNDLREVKAKYKALTHHQEDVKHLKDIPYYWTQMVSLGLPQYQYTIRDTKSGGTILGFADEYSEQYSILFTTYYLEWLKFFEIDLGEVIIQTDNGSEFGGGRQRHVKPEGFVDIIEGKFGAKHNFIPPSMSNANADVESIHNTIEVEFFDLESFGSRGDFFKKAQMYQNFYNFVRPNFSKKAKTPVQIISDDRHNLSPSVLYTPIVDLDKLYRTKFFPGEGGQHVPNLSDKNFS